MPRVPFPFLISPYLHTQHLSHDTVANIREKVLGHIFDLLYQKPEQKQSLLQLLVNKLGDPVRKVASKCIFFLLKLCPLICDEGMKRKRKRTQDEEREREKEKLEGEMEKLKGEMEKLKGVCGISEAKIDSTRGGMAGTTRAEITSRT
eukprot:Em0005g1138a